LERGLPALKPLQSEKKTTRKKKAQQMSKIARKAKGKKSEKKKQGRVQPKTQDLKSEQKKRQEEKRRPIAKSKIKQTTKDKSCLHKSSSFEVPTATSLQKELSPPSKTLCCTMSPVIDALHSMGFSRQQSERAVSQIKERDVLETVREEYRGVLLKKYVQDAVAVILSNEKKDGSKSPALNSIQDSLVSDSYCRTGSGEIFARRATSSPLAPDKENGDCPAEVESERMPDPLQKPSIHSAREGIAKNTSPVSQFTPTMASLKSTTKPCCQSRAGECAEDPDFWVKIEGRPMKIDDSKSQYDAIDASAKIAPMPALPSPALSSVTLPMKNRTRSDRNLGSIGKPKGLNRTAKASPSDLIHKDSLPKSRAMTTSNYSTAFEMPDLDLSGKPHGVTSPMLLSAISGWSGPDSQFDADPPSNFCCPITGELMVCPVTAMDGFTYERAAVQAWLMSRKSINESGEDVFFSPQTGSPMKCDLVFNYSINESILQWKMGHRVEKGSNKVWDSWTTDVSEKPGEAHGW
jgi:hypothetical protein